MTGTMADLRAALARNAVLTDVLTRAASLALPGWYVSAGCLTQAVWNAVTGRPPEHGIRDYDLIYFDAADLSWEAEDAVIRAAHKAFAAVPATVEVRNQARVHLWYEGKFGVPCPALPSCEAAIDRFPATANCLGVRVEPDGEWHLYAPHGVSDVFNLVVRPNPVLAPREVYETKTARWKREWPELTILPWPEADTATADRALCGKPIN